MSFAENDLIDKHLERVLIDGLNQSAVCLELENTEPPRDPPLSALPPWFHVD